MLSRITKILLAVVQHMEIRVTLVLQKRDLTIIISEEQTIDEYSLIECKEILHIDNSRS